MNQEQFNQLMGRLNEIESRLFVLEHPGVMRIEVNDIGEVSPTPCSHTDAYHTSGGWYCPSCGLAYNSYLQPHQPFDASYWLQLGCP